MFERTVCALDSNSLACRCRRRLFVWAILFVGMCLPAAAQVVVSISPTAVPAGGPGFTLTVTGSGFVPGSIVQINGSSRSTAYVSSLQLTATIFASDIALPATLPVRVFNSSGVGGSTSNAVTLTVTSAPSPVLGSASPQFAAQSAQSVLMTLVGSNLRPGATVVISPPLTALGASNGHARANDVSVLSVTVVNPGVITALINVSPTAAAGLRAVDVLNLDGTSSAGGAVAGTSQPFRVEASNSLSAPLSISNIVLSSPRNGTVTTQGATLNAEAVLAGTGTGTVIGQWVWDDKIVEQFSASIVGGRSTTIKTRQSLPTWSLGGHTLQLRMVQPNQVATRAIEVVVNPGSWKLERLIAPAYGAAFPSNQPPHLLWTPVPGAMKYQVGFASQPYLSTIDKWFDVQDNQWAVPPAVWKSLPEGKLYWTTRAVDPSGEPRKALPMRRIDHLSDGHMHDGGLNPVRPVPARTPAGNTLLEWEAAPSSVLYAVTITSDLAGKQVLRRYLTSDTKLDLRAIDGKLIPGTTYFWHVDAIAANGMVMMHGAVQSFMAQAVAHAGLHHAPRLILLASLGAPESLPAGGDLASSIAGQMPVPGSTTDQAQPSITASFQQPVSPPDVSMMIDSVDITPLAQVTATSIAYTPPLAFASGEHAVTLTVGSDSTTWKFTVTTVDASSTTAPAADASTIPAAAAYQQGTDAEAPPSGPPALPAPDTGSAAPAPVKPARPVEDGQIAMNTQWASGSNPPDSNILSAAEHVLYQNGPSHAELNGSGLLNSILNPEALRTSRGKVNDYVLQLGYAKRRWGVHARVGLISPVLYTDAQFITTATARLGGELTLNTPAGLFGGFRNINDAAPGGGFGVNVPQRIMGASWQAPLPQWAQFRMMWLNADDIGAPHSTGDIYGALLNIHFTPQWLLSSEYAISHNNPDTTNSASRRAFGRAWRSGLSGQPSKSNVSVVFHEVSQNFGNPANPGLTPSSQPNTHGMDSAFTQTTHAGTFGLNYTFLGSNFHPSTSDELLLNTFAESWSKAFGVKTNLAVTARQSLTETGTVPPALVGLAPSVTGAQDERDLSGNITLSRQVGMTTLSAGAVRDWNHNTFFPLASTITTSLNVGANIVTRGIFQLNSQASVNWVAGAGSTVGTARNISFNAQPAFTWKQPALQVSPLLTITQGQTILSSGTFTTNVFTGQYGGRLAWTLPGVLKFNTLSAQGSYSQNRNRVTGIDQPSTQLLVLWTAVWGHQRTL